MKFFINYGRCYQIFTRGHIYLQNKQEINFSHSNICMSVSLLCIVFLFTCGCTSLPDSPRSQEDKSSTGNITITDATNNTISLSHPAQRIVTTSTYATEYLVVIGAADKIVGNKDEILNDPLFQRYLTHAQVVGSSGAMDVEKVVSLNPDIVLITQDTSASTIEKFQKANLTVASFDYYSLDALPETIQALGKITGKTEQAENYLRFYQKYDNIISERLKNISTNQETSAYYEMNGDYNTAGKGSGGYNYLEKMHVKNIAGELTVNYPKVSPEWIIAGDPEVITKNGGPSQNLSECHNTLVTRPGFSTISAVRNNRTYMVSTNILYGPRNIVGLIYLAKISYPERFKDISPESVLNDYAASFFTGANITDTVYPKLQITN